MDNNELMTVAIGEAQKALAQDEVPIGAIVFGVLENKIIGRGFNQKEGSWDPTAHAEVIALREACAYRQNWRLPDTILVSTVEPCAMCVGALIQARVPRVIYGCRDDKFGALGSIVDLRDQKWNHKFEVQEGILKEECQKLLQDFFDNLRK